jgi:hypothetical protein
VEQPVAITQVPVLLGGGHPYVHVHVHALPYRAGAYQERTPLMHEIRREGIDIR